MRTLLVFLMLAILVVAGCGSGHKNPIGISMEEDLLPLRYGSTSNSWFDISAKAITPPDGYIWGYPVYHQGDRIEVELEVENKNGVPLNLYPFIYGEIKISQRHHDLEMGDPTNHLLLVPPFGKKTILHEINIPDGWPVGRSELVVNIDVLIFGGIIRRLVSEKTFYCFISQG